jgi:radical SAM superfamily enzyme YgiQ (UPF0313 family)
VKVLLVQPQSPRYLGFKYLALTEPLGLEAVAASIKNHDLRILDLRLEKSLAKVLRRFKPEAVGLSVPFTTAVYKSQYILSEIKKFNPRIFTFVGGHHASLNPYDFLGYADVVVTGEGEKTCPELLEAVARGRDLREVPGLVYLKDQEPIFTPVQPLISPLDKIPTPARHLTEKYRDSYFYKEKKPLTMVETTRGCPYRCKFCSVWRFHNGKYRQLSPERVLSELKAVETEDVLFSDDNFLENVRRAEKIYQLIKASGLRKKFGFQARTDTIARHPEIIKKWREIGLDWVLIGFESFREKDLKELDKKTTVEVNEAAVKVLQENSINIQAAFIVHPDYSRREFEALGRYIKKLKLFSCQITVLTPIPGTDFFREKIQELTSRNYELFDFLHAVLPTKLPLDQFYEEFCRLYRKISISFNIKNVLKSPFSYSLKDIIQAVKVFNNLLRPKAYLKGHFKSYPCTLSESKAR